MTVWRPKGRRHFRYRFFLRGQKYEGNTGMSVLADASEWETQEQRKRERDLGGLPVLAEHTPRFTDWAAVYLQHTRSRGRIRRVDRLEELLRVVLRFWGGKPSGQNKKNPPVDGEPYHDLRLADPIRDPQWIVKFESWMSARTVRLTGKPLANQTKNHYRSIMSRLYRLAEQPQFQKVTGIQKNQNPFRGLERDPTRSRRVTVTPGQLRKWFLKTPRHAQLAIAIAALAPKLRLENILSLQWHVHLDSALQYITVEEHKTVDQTDEPLVVPVSTQLRSILKAEPRRGTYVVMYRGHRVKSIRHAVRTGAEAAGLTYGRDVPGGVTFHTIRHTAATLLAGMSSLTEALRSATMGQDILTTQKYTHLRPVAQRPVVNRLGRVIDLERGRKSTAADTRRKYRPK